MTVSCDMYAATFAESVFVVPDTVVIGLPALKQCCESWNGQHSVQEMNQHKFVKLLRKKLPDVPSSSLITSEWETLGQDEAVDVDENGKDQDDGNESHSYALGLIKRHRGQKKFRDKLRRKFADKCFVTGCNVVDLLEAAHIVP